ncbi:MAG: outer membrane beta-barrel protein [Omnitrophica bacterium]|nr:outer membrane beta-barrel protein [Candidatus Omnitrophota bacterium]
MLYKIAIILAVCIISGLAFPCYAGGIRDEIISFNLDYYELKSTLDTEREEQGLEKEWKLEEKEKVLAEKAAAAKVIWNRRKKVVRTFFDDLKYSLIFQQEYNDNIFRTDQNEEADSVTEVSLGLSYVPKVSLIKKRKLDLFFDLKGGALGYNSNSGSNTGNLALRLGLNYILAKKYGLFFDYSLSKQQTTASQVSTGGSRKEFVDFWLYDMGVKFQADWGRFPWAIRYNRRTPDYGSDFLGSEVITDTVFLSGHIKLLPKTNFLWRYDLGKVEYPNRVSDDYDFFKLWAGVRGKLSSKIKGLVEVGFGEYDYADRTKDTEEVKVKLDYNFSRRLLVNFSANRSLVVSPFTTDSSSQETKLSLNCKYLPPFNKNIVFSMQSSFSNNDYESGREDENWTYGFDVRYGFKRWGVFGFSYNHNERESNIQTESYTQNIFSVNAKVSF